MFPVTRDVWTHPDQSSSPKAQCFRATDTSSLAHQIANNSPHSFYSACGAWQIQLRVFAISPKMIDPPEKFTDRHAHHARSHWLRNEPLQPLEHPSQACAVREFQRLAGELVERLSYRSSYQFALSSSSAALQLADEVKMAQLHDPALPRGQRDHASNIVRYRGADAPVYSCRNGCECLRPAAYVLSPGKKQRVQEHRSVFVARLHSHEVQDPMAVPKPEVKSVHKKDQRPWRQAQSSRSRDELAQGLTKTVRQGLRCKTGARSKTFQSLPLQQDGLQESGRSSPRLAASPLSADPPRTLAMAALTPSRTEAMNFCSATGRVRVRRIHARELATDWGLKYGKSQKNSV